MTDDQRRLLAVDLYIDPGRTFRLPPEWYADVSANLCTANMDFDEFANVADESGTYRGCALPFYSAVGFVPVDRVSTALGAGLHMVLDSGRT